MARIQIARLAVALLLAIAPIAMAAAPTVPASLPYQGLLLDGLGQPRTGSVDLTVRVFDALIGGALVYKQSFPAVPLADGVFSVQLGPIGEASDAPSNPLTTDLATALGGDAGATSPVRFLEVTVGADGALSRTQILSSAYALRATSAATADTAQTANDAANVGGVDAYFVSQVYQYFNFDGGPPTTDPREGLGDTDGDGRANFIDNDNDDDTLTDTNEMEDGSDINLVSPRITAVAPTKLFFTSSSTVTVEGTGFAPGLSVVFGTQTPSPTNVTPTSFNVHVGAQPAGFGDVSVTNANGQTHTAVGSFEFVNAVNHTISLLANRTTFAARPGTLEVVLGGNQEYGVGVAAEGEFAFGSVGSIGQIGMTFDPTGKVAGLRCRGGGSTCDVEILVDSDGDNGLADEVAIPVEVASGGTPTLLAADLKATAAGNWVAAYVRRTFGPDVVIAHDRNGDGDFADLNERLTIDSGLGNANVATAADLAVDGAGRVAYVYYRAIGTAIRVAHDRSGDGDYADTVDGNPELSTLATATPTCLGATFDGAGHLAVIWGDSAGTGATLARDTNGDGDFTDAGETVAIVTGSSTTACDVDYRPGQPFAVLHNAGGSASLLHLKLDKNDDGDFADVGEDQTLVSSAGTDAALALNGVSNALIATQTKIVVGVTD
jgi:hypothetical protein